MIIFANIRSRQELLFFILNEHVEQTVHTLLVAITENLVFVSYLEDTN
jgi:hypothetical protein